MMEPLEIVIRIFVHSDGTVEYIPRAKPPIGEDVPSPEDVKKKIEPKIKFTCERYGRVVNKKKAGTCHGCTIRCHYKGKYKGETIEV